MDPAAASSTSGRAPHSDDDKELMMVGHVHIIERAVLRLEFLLSRLDHSAHLKQDTEALLDTIASGMRILEIITKTVDSLHILLEAIEKYRPSYSYFLSVFPKHKPVLTKAIQELHKVAENLTHSLTPTH